MSSTELFEAASISTTSSELPAMIAAHAVSSGEKSTRGPPSAFRAHASSLAMLVLPVPRSHEEIRVVHLAELDRVPQGAHDVLLRDHLVKGSGAVAAVKREHQSIVAAGPAGAGDRERAPTPTAAPPTAPAWPGRRRPPGAASIGSSRGRGTSGARTRRAAGASRASSSS